MKDLVVGIGHAAYHTAQMDKILDFYCNKLGFTHAFSLNDDDGNPWIEYIKLTNNSFIEFFYASPERAELLKTSDKWMQHTCIIVSDVDETVKFLKSNDIKIIIGPTVGKDGNPQCWIADPDGNPLELMSISEDSLQVKSK